jgi:23S rRNA pseudouridine1911/1915/1917 synthase
VVEAPATPRGFSQVNTSERNETFTVERSLPNERFDKFLADRYPAVSRATLQRLIEGGHIRVNGQGIKPTHHPRAGEKVSVHWPPPKSSEIKPQAIPLDILHEDEHLLVLNKSPGMVVHPSAGHEDSTLVNALLHHCRGQLSGIAGVARPGIVHRLDEDTSGCLVVAKDDTAHLALSKQFAARTMRKVYHAIVCGVMTNDTGSIRAPIGRHPSKRKIMTVLDTGRDSWTAFRVRERLRGATHVEIDLHTGRTHQIRVHFQYIGHPVVGDLVYGAKPNARLSEFTGCVAPRQLLHAHTLAFTHPATGAQLEFEAPLPKDFRAALKKLREPA